MDWLGTLLMMRKHSKSKLYINSLLQDPESIEKHLIITAHIYA